MFVRMKQLIKKQTPFGYNSTPIKASFLQADQIDQNIISVMLLNYVNMPGAQLCSKLDMYGINRYFYRVHYNGSSKVRKYNAGKSL